MDIPYVYKITNLITNQLYIGATTRCPSQRLIEHCRDAIRFPDRPLYAAINEYGKEKFIVDIHEECEEAELEVKEAYWIERTGSFKNGYNATIGGSGKPSASYDLIILLWNEGKNVKEIKETTGYDGITIKKAVEANNVFSDERKERATAIKRKAVAMIDMKTQQIIQIFPSIEAAYKNLGKEHSGHIAAVCSGKRKTAYGYSWEYWN